MGGLLLRMRTIFTLNLLSEDRFKRPNTLSYTRPATHGIPISHQILRILVRLLIFVVDCVVLNTCTYCREKANVENFANQKLVFTNCTQHSLV